ncbi:hypothetical protein A2961_03340 [Candidatus Woesebacteria bacterium RIFCSPLOWO2_01_FULL_39_21]|uniref:Glutamine amidotransferase domain-containing protein n=1 Tax=Candidatus Woesebacteria bacterium RIFCSPLOWO2_01_FULL_39_21 TaxID=1802519 RepID=A0A1F8BHA9_9BACT|nr:MAG: hypothetical protein A2961_03340 [Candidatus Woesebacteria bacterium RIFCSPLOWO2_01_FULL_39_21]
MVEERGIEIKEVEPRAKILFLNFSPGKEPHIRMAQEMFGSSETSVDKFAQMASLEANVPTREEEPDTLKRESVAKLDLPESVSGFKGIVITGSPFAAYPRETDDNRLFLAAWKNELFTFIRAAVEKNVPILGICFGGQVLAEALGGKVEKMKSSRGEPYETGWARIYRTGGTNDPVLQGIQGEFVAAENHEDVITRLPEGAILLADNEYGVQVFRYKKAWGFEFHPERLPETVGQQLKVKVRRERMKGLGQDPDANRKLGEEYDPNIRTIFRNFLHYAWKGVQ